MTNFEEPEQVEDCARALASVLLWLDALAKDPATIPRADVTLAANYVQHALELLRRT